MSYRLCEGIRPVQSRTNETFLISNRPLRAVRVNADLAARLVDGEREYATQEQRALEQLRLGGFVRYESDSLAESTFFPSISIVVPVKDRADELRHCLASLAQLDYPVEKIEIIVVDDGSSDESRAVARAAGVTVINSGAVGGGPARARNRGVAEAQGELVAFIDSDCVATTHWLKPLVEPFRTGRVAAVGGLVSGLRNGCLLDRYEAVMSSLSLGKREMRGSTGDDTFYLPSCNLLVRREFFLQAGGFREALHVGEDVDLTWRLRDEGYEIRYLPEGEVHHDHRSRLWPFLRRRFQYGTSEGILQTLHPAREKKMVTPPRLVLALLLLLLPVILGSWLLIGVGMASAALIMLIDAAISFRPLQQRGLPFSFMTVLGARTRALGSLAYYSGYHLVRYYLPLLLVASIAFPSLIVFCAAMTVAISRVDFCTRQPKMSFLPFAWYYLLEQIAYSLGVFTGCWRQKNFSSYRIRWHVSAASAR